MSKRLLIVEEALRDKKAHWYAYLKTIDAEAKKCGWSVDIVCNRNADSDILKDFSAYPLFGFSYYLDQGLKKTFLKRYFSFFTHSFKSFRVLSSFLKTQPKFDEIFVPTVVAQHLLCWWAIMLFHLKKPKRLTLFFVTNPGIFVSTDQAVMFPKSSRIFAFFLTLFKPMVFKKNVRLAVETKGAQKEFKHISKLPFHLFPHPVPAQNDFSKDQLDKYAGMKVFSCFGFARHEKGSDLLKAAVIRLMTLPDHQDLKFIIQWTDPFKMPDGSWCMPGETLSNHLQVDLITSPLDTQQYEKMIHITDCMILPYRNRAYHARVSRVAIEAVCAGIPLIYSKGGWLEQLVFEFGCGVGFQDESIDDLIKAIDVMRNSINDFKNEASFKSNKAKTYFSPTNFVNYLFDS